MRYGLVLAFCATVAVSGANAAEYTGLCEASAGAFLDSTHFAVASDETNVIQIYQRGKPDPVGQADMRQFTAFDKSDLEGAAAIGDRIYWVSSHSLNSKGKDIPKRKVFFATKVEMVAGKPVLKGVGLAAKSLRDPLAKAAGVTPSALNIEGLAATPEGGLLIGLRSPLNAAKHALILPFRNPGAVVDTGAQPEFDAVIPVDLAGRGIRSIDLVGTNPDQYLIVAGPVVDAAEGFALYRWSGPKTNKLEELKSIKLTGIRPEALMAVPGEKAIQLLSDDGELCSDEDDPPAKRKFRSVDVTP